MSRGRRWSTNSAEFLREGELAFGDFEIHSRPRALKHTLSVINDDGDNHGTMGRFAGRVHTWDRIRRKATGVWVFVGRFGVQPGPNFFFGP